MSYGSTTEATIRDAVTVGDKVLPLGISINMVEFLSEVLCGYIM